MQNMVQGCEWQEFQTKAENIDKLTEWALQKQSQRISDKYSSISNTVKLLKNLMLEFTRKAESLEKQLLTVSRVEQTQFQSIYHQKRIAQCLELSQKLRAQIQSKKEMLNEQQSTRSLLRRQLAKLKTGNIKLEVKIEEEEQKWFREVLKENSENGGGRRTIREEDGHWVPTGSCFKIEKSQLREEYRQVEGQLLAKISSALSLRKLIEGSFAALRSKLKKQQKKSNLYGIAGSMLFKLEGGSLAQRPKKLGDSKLMIYDILKQKYRRHVKQEKKKEEELAIPLEQFLQFSPLQIAGVIELKGGLPNIINQKWSAGLSSRAPDAPGIGVGYKIEEEESQNQP